MPNASNKHFTTLNHLYNDPVQHQRDFVRENKQNVREISKHQAKGKQLQKVDGSTPFTSSADRISSRSSGFTSNTVQAPRIAVKPQILNGNRRAPSPKNQKSKKQPWTYYGESADRQNANKLERLQQQGPKRPPPTSTTKVNKTKAVCSFNSKAVQTDEIDDEMYLYNALKKCASPAFKSALKAKYLQKERESQKNKQLANTSRELALSLDETTKELQEYLENINEGKQLNSDDIQSTIVKPSMQQRTESVQTDFTTDFIKNSQRSKMIDYPTSHITDSHRRNELNCKLSYRQKAGTDELQRPESVQTILTEESQSSTMDYHTSRATDAYKRASLNVMTMPAGTDSTPTKCTNCPNCPIGYHLLGEEERERVRAKLLQHEALLIKQLNSFPLAIETLRVRQSKTRIEKELSILEQNLRKLTKRKVYVKIHE